MISGVTFIAALFERSMQGAGFVSSSASSTDRGSRSPETMARGVSVVFRELTERASSFLCFFYVNNDVRVWQSKFPHLFRGH